MKRVLVLLLISLFSVQLCFATEDSDENIEQYFSQEPEVTKQIDGGIEYNVQEEQEPERESVHLDEDVLYKQVNFARPKKISSDSLSLDKKKPTFQPFGSELDAASKFSTQEYSISPVNSVVAGKIGKFSFGTKYDSYLDSGAEVNYSTAIFTKYEGNHLALTMSFLKSTGNDYASYSDKIMVAPELKITKRLSLLDVMQTDVQQINKKNELVLRYTPNFRKYADDVQFELGAGQSFYNDNFINSSVRFSTKFKL